MRINGCLTNIVLVGHSFPIPLELTPALNMCCDAVTTCDYSIHSFVIPEYKLTYYTFWMALQCSLHLVQSICDLT